jgi:type I restriction enzyme S subunit
MTPEQFFAEFAHIADAPNGVQKLRELILQLAVRGKLVPQDPTDEPAAKLLERIQAEKAKLVKEKKIRNSEPLPPINEDEIPYDLPGGWQWARLGEIANISTGYAFKSPDYVSDGVFVLRVTNIQPDGVINKQEAVFFPKSKIDDRINTYYLNKDDLLVVMVGGSLGKVGTVTENILPALLNQNMWRITPLKPELPFQYLRLCLRYINNYQLKITHSTHGHLAMGEYQLQVVGIPSANEQHRIMAKVDQLMALCDELEAKQVRKQQKLTRLNNAAIDRLLTSHEQAEFSEAWGLVRDNFDLIYTTPDTISKLRQAILQLAVQGKLVPQDPSDEPASALLARIKAEKERLVKEKKIRKSDPLPPVSANEAPYELPPGWEWVRFVDIANIASNLVKTEPYLDFPHVAPDNIEKFTGKLLPYRTVREDGVMSGKHLFFKGQILYSKIRPNLSKVTIVDFDGLCSADMYPIDAYISPLYLMHYMLSSTFLDMAVKKDTRVAMPKINQEELNRIIVPVCPLAEQHRIVAKVGRLMVLCDEIESRMTKTQGKAEKLASAAVQGLLAA